MSWTEFLNERPIAVIATVDVDGAPHAVPVEVFVHDGLVYCWCERASVKARNVKRTGRATITGYKGHAFVMVRGPARLVEHGREAYDQITRGFLDKYNREESYGNDTLIEITPERVSSDRVE